MKMKLFILMLSLFLSSSMIGMAMNENQLMIDHINKVVADIPEESPANIIRIKRRLEAARASFQKNNDWGSLYNNLDNIAEDIVGASYKQERYNSTLWDSPITLEDFRKTLLTDLIDHVFRSISAPAQPQPAKPSPATPMPQPTPQPTQPSPRPSKPFAKPQPQPQPAQPKPAPQPRITEMVHGLNNVQNSCFMNAALQCLLACDVFNNSLLGHAAQYKGTIGEIYLQLLQAYRSSAAQATVTPLDFCVRGWEMMSMPRGSQQDSNEFMHRLLDNLIEPNGLKLGAIAQLIEFSYKNVLSADGNSSENVTRDTVLFLPIQEADKALTDCFKHIFKTEMVQYEGRERKQVTYIDRSGKYLMIALRRNVYDVPTQSLVKVNAPISFPVTHFSLDQFSGEKSLAPYRLKGIVIHAGSPHGGHYTSYVRYNDAWYFCNDSMVQLVSSNDIEQMAHRGYGSDKSQLPVMFFYEAQ